MNQSSVKLWGSALLAAFCLTVPATSFAGILSNKERVSLIEPAEPRIHGNATFGAFGSDEGFRGSFEALAPLAFDGRQLLFLYPEFMADDEGAQFYSIGLGYRVLLDQPNIILGANIFYDNGESPYDNRVHRLGLGAEVLGERFSARINYYFSDGDEHLIDSRTLSSSSTSSKVVGRSTSPGAIVRGPGGTFQSVTTSTKIRTTTTTTSRTFERFEQGMDGLDAELGFQIPMPEKLHRLPELWLYAGYYDYSSDYGRDLNGFKARAELRFGDRFTIDAAYYEDDGLIGSHWLAGARVHIPFGGGYETPVGWAGKRGLMTASAEPYGDGASSNLLLRRMTENIIRDNKTYTSQSDFIENPDLRRISRRSRTSERVSTSLRQIEIRTGIIFVDGANTEPGDGSFDNPFQNLSLAQTEAQARATGSGLEQTIYVFDTSPGYEEAVTFNGAGIAGFSVNLLDSSNPITFEGTPIGGAAPKAQWTAPDGLTPLVLTNIDQFEISGFNITSQGADTLFAQNVNRLILNDTMLNAMPGRALHLDGVAQVVANNVSVNTSGGTNGIRIVNSGGPAPSTLNFATTQFDTPAGSAVFLQNNLGSFTFRSLTIDQGANGSGIQMLNNPSGTFTFTDTTITDTVAPGLLLVAGAADVIFDGTSSITRRIGSPAIHVTGGHTGSLTFAPGTSVAGIGGGGGLLFADADGRYDFQGDVTLFESNSGIDIIGGSDGTFTFANTTITDPATTGLFVDSGSANVNFGGTSSISQSNPMLAVRAGGGHTGTLTFDPTTSIAATGGDGLQFNNADGTYNFNGPVTLNGGDAGIDILGGSAGTFTFSSATTITNPTGAGLNIADLESGGRVDYNGSIVNNNDVIYSIDKTAPGSAINLIANGGNSLTSTDNPNGAIFIFDADGDITVTTPTTITRPGFSSLFATDGDGIWTFDDLTIVDQMGLNGGVDVFGQMGVVNFNNLNITTDSAGTGDATTGFLAGGNQVINVMGNSSVSADGGGAVVLINIGEVNMTWQSLSAQNNLNSQVGFAGDDGIEFLNVAGGTFNVTGTTTVQNVDGVGLSFEDVGASVTLANIALDNIGLDGIISSVVFDNTGSLTVNGGTISNIGADGIRVGSTAGGGSGALGGFNLNNTTFSGIGGSTIRAANSVLSGAGNVAVPFSSTDNGGNTGTILFNGGTDSAP